MSQEQFEQTEQEIIDAFYPSAESEPLDTPTDEAPEEVPEEPEAQADDEPEGEAEAEEESDEEGDILVYEINGKEYTADDIKELEASTLRQSDYTKKTQALAREREAVEQSKALLNDSIAKTKDLAAQLEVLVAEDKEIDWADLKQYDPEEYINQKEKADARAKKLSEVKADLSPSVQFDPGVERKKLADANPSWVADGKPTEAYKSDMNILSAYFEQQGITQEEVKFISQNAKVSQLFIDEAKRTAKSTKEAVKVESARKKIIKAPKATRPAAQTTTVSDEELWYGNTKK